MGYLTFSCVIRKLLLFLELLLHSVILLHKSRRKGTACDRCGGKVIGNVFSSSSSGFGVLFPWRRRLCLSSANKASGHIFTAKNVCAYQCLTYDMMLLSMILLRREYDSKLSQRHTWGLYCITFISFFFYSVVLLDEELCWNTFIEEFISFQIKKAT